MSRILVVCTTDSMIWNFLVPHIKELEKNGHYVECACSQTGSFFNQLADVYGLKMNLICFRRTPYSLKNLKAYRQLCKLIKEKHFDTVFCHEPVGGAIGRLAGHKTKCKVVYMAHGFHFYKGAPKTRIIYKWVEKWLSKYTDTLITINEEDYKASLSFKAKECVKVNGVGVDVSKYAQKPDRNYLRKELGLSDDQMIFLSVGELIKRKNHETFIKAMVQNGDPRFVYVIAGSGKLESHLRHLIEKQNLGNRVYLLGYRTDISLLCNSADVFVLPSIHEGLSVALMEAMSCGKPAIVSNIRGNSDLIDNNKGGYLVQTFDLSEYSIAMKEIVSHIEEFGQYNIERIKLFDIKNIAPSIQKLFN